MKCHASEKKICKKIREKILLTHVTAEKDTQKRYSFFRSVSAGVYFFPVSERVYLKKNKTTQLDFHPPLWGALRDGRGDVTPMPTFFLTSLV